ncbi:hypothetical protein E2320_019723, partial [Naja naja]
YTNRPQRALRTLVQSRNDDKLEINYQKPNGFYHQQKAGMIEVESGMYIASRKPLVKAQHLLLRLITIDSSGHFSIYMDQGWTI